MRKITPINGKVESKLKTEALPPLTAEMLRKTEIKPKRHHVEHPVSSGAVLFDVSTANTEEPPAVKTRLVRVDGRGRDVAWQVEVSVGGGELRPARPSAAELVQIDRAVLARDTVAALSPSMPHGEGKIIVRPRRRKLPDPYKIRFGELRYDPTTIFHPDGRYPFYDESYPWRCLVRITTARGWSGSGVLIGPRHVLTASHCVDWPSRWMRVDVMYSSSTSLAFAEGIFFYFASMVGPGGPIPDEQTDEDYAVIVLDKPLGKQYGWLGCRTYDSGWDDEVSAWHSIGYPYDLSRSGEIAAWQTDFLLNELAADYGSARLIRSETLDIYGGQSGSPVFGFWSDGPYVVGVISGELPDYNYISGGSLLTSLVSRARKEYP
jgi:V8-like Glu-specific endopeptidase